MRVKERVCDGGKKCERERVRERLWERVRKRASWKRNVIVHWKLFCLKRMFASRISGYLTGDGNIQDEVFKRKAMERHLLNVDSRHKFERNYSILSVERKIAFLFFEKIVLIIERTPRRFCMGRAALRKTSNELVMSRCTEENGFSGHFTALCERDAYA